MATQIQIRRDSTANWTNLNPILAQGELGLDLNVNNIKVGNGLSAWNVLPYQFTTGTNFNSLSSETRSVYSNVNSNSANYILHGGNSKTQNLLIGTNDSYDLNFETAGVTRMNINTSGNTTLTNDLSVGGSTYSNEFPFINKIPAKTDLQNTGGGLTPYLWFSNGGDSSSGMTCSQANCILTPIWIPVNCTIQYGGLITGANGSPIDVDVALYSANQNGLPDTRVMYANPTAASTGAGNIVTASGTASVKRGMYWGAVSNFNSTSVVLYQSIPSGLAITGGTFLRAFHTGFDRLLPRYTGMNNTVAIHTSIGIGNRLPTTFAGTGRLLEFVGSNTTPSQTTYRTRTDAPFVFFIPSTYN